MDLFTSNYLASIVPGLRGKTKPDISQISRTRAVPVEGGVGTIDFEIWLKTRPGMKNMFWGKIDFRSYPNQFEILIVPAL